LLDRIRVGEYSEGFACRLTSNIFQTIGQFHAKNMVGAVFLHMSANEYTGELV
jgi:hypothetical protein